MPNMLCEQCNAITWHKDVTYNSRRFGSKYECENCKTSQRHGK